MQASQVERGNNKIFLKHIQHLKKVWKMIRPYKVFIPSFFREWGFLAGSDVHDPVKLTKDAVDKKLNPFASQLHFYDGSMHQSMFAFPKELGAHF